MWFIIGRGVPAGTDMGRGFTGESQFSLGVKRGREEETIK